jgi:hypothetical protein
VFLLSGLAGIDAQVLRSTSYSVIVASADLIRFVGHTVFQEKIVGFETLGQGKRACPVALCWMAALLHRGFILMLQKNPESDSVRDQQ